MLIVYLKLVVMNVKVTSKRMVVGVFLGVGAG